VGSKIPKVVREKAVTEWLQGLARDEIAQNNGIGDGTVTEIIKEYRENGSDIDQQREFVVALKREGTDLNLFASSVRLKRFTEELGIDEERLDPFLVNVQEHCFKKNIETKDFIKSVNDVCNMANEMQVTVEDLPHKLQQMLNELNLLEEKKRKKADKSWPQMDSYIRRMRRRQLYEFKEIFNRGS
jgi:uncharacterized protein YpuA (DUF1002 family)